MKAAYLFSIVAPALSLAANSISNVTSIADRPSTHSTRIPTCSTTKYYTASHGNGTAYNATTILYNISCPLTTTKTIVAPTYAVYTPAPWLANLPQTTVVHVETIVVAHSTLYRSFSFAVPAPTTAVNGKSSVVAACPAPSTVTVSISSCPTSTQVNGRPINVANSPAVPAAGTAAAANGNNANPGIAPTPVAGVSTRVTTSTKTQVSTITSYSAATSYSTNTVYYTITGLAGTTTTSSLAVVTVVATSTIVRPTTITVTITETIVNTESAAQSTQTGASVLTETFSTAKLTQSVLYSNSTSSGASLSSHTATTSAVVGSPIIVPGQPGSVSSISSSSSMSAQSTSASSTVLVVLSSASESISSTSQSSASLESVSSTSPSSASSESAITMALSATTSEAASSSLSSSTSASSTFLALSTTSSSSPVSSLPQPTSTQISSSSAAPLTLSSSSSSSASAACPIGTLAASATAPAPPAGTNVYNIAGNAPYNISEADLLSQISFPNGFNCNNKLVILQPGTAVPAIDTYSNTFIPAFSDPETMAETGGVDIMLISNPTTSLGPVWQTAEYVAYALDYANLVLKRPGTIIAWSQGNLNVQWAFKYWPSTRTSVPGRNYVAMSADYDGTIEATLLCQPISVLTGGSGMTLLDDFVTQGGLATVLQAIGISGVPTDASGLTDPEAFRVLLLSLVFGNAASIAGPIVGSSSATSSVAAATSSADSLLPTSLPDLLPLGKRAVPFGKRDEVVDVLRSHVEKRQTTLPGALDTLLSGVSDSILNELAEIVVNPDANIMQIFANLAKLATDPTNISLLPTGCNPAVWDQTYFSEVVTTLAEDGGALAYVPTTSIFSITDEVVEPQGATGFEAASGYMAGSNNGVIAPENILIQQYCSAISNTLDANAPPLITHEGVLASGMGVAAGILAVISQSTVSYDDIVAAYGATEACALISQRLTLADYLGNEATIPGALLRITVNPGTMDPYAQFSPGPYALPAYATQ